MQPQDRRPEDRAEPEMRPEMRPEERPQNDRMGEVQARTTPGTDPRVEEMAREQHAGQEPGMSEGYDRGAGMPRERQGEEFRREERQGAGEASRAGMGDRRDQRMGAGYQDTSMGAQTGGAGSEFEHFRVRMQEAQARFIDDPKRAVEEAGAVVEEAIDRFMHSIDRGTGEGGDTERMRMTMQRYREVFDRVTSSSR